MNTLAAFAMGRATAGATMRVFDWDKALKILHKHNIKTAYAGLSGDMEHTSDIIIEDGKLVVPKYAYLKSTWATPMIAVYDDDEDSETEYACWCWNDEENNPHHYDQHSTWEKRHFDEWEKMNAQS